MSLFTKTVVSIAFGGLCLFTTARAQQGPAGHDHAEAADQTQAEHQRPSWDPELIDEFAALPVQEGGRIKPLYTEAIWLLRRLNGKASVVTPPLPGQDKGERLGPVEWFLDTLFFPDHAIDYEVFRIEDDQVVVALGLSFRNKEGFKTKNRFDRYSFRELQPGFDKLIELAQSAQQKEQKHRSQLETNILALYSGLNEFTNLLNHLNFARNEIPIEPALRPVFDGKSSIHVTDALFKARELRQFARQMQDPSGLSAEEQAARRTAYSSFSQAIREAVTQADHHPVLLPPSLDHDKSPAWMTPRDLVLAVVFEEGDFAGQDLNTQARLLATLAGMAREAHDSVAFAKDARVLIPGLTNLALRRGEARKAGAEVWLYEMEFFWNAIYAFFAGFLMLALAWIFPKGIDIRTSFGLVGLIVFGGGYAGMMLGVQPHMLITILFFVPGLFFLLRRSFPIRAQMVRGALGFALLGTALMITGIAVRGYVRGRPPISTLYETFPFITSICVLASLVIEWVQRRGLGLAVALLLGFVGLMLGNSYADMKAEDTMPQLVAVLDTNFWLATHVTTINIGYAAGMLAGIIAHIFILGKLFGFKRNDRAFYKVIVRMVYGVLAFALIFSVVGTILGGIWANDSWGRFWGWDPKENGALMICLVEAAILHGRMGGFLRDFGICIGAVFGSIVVAFSWFHVNLLGIGLHSYGFDADLKNNLFIFYGIEGVVILAGIVALLMDRARKNAIADAAHRSSGTA